MAASKLVVIAQDLPIGQVLADALSNAISIVWSARFLLASSPLYTLKLTRFASAQLCIQWNSSVEIKVNRWAADRRIYLPWVTSMSRLVSSGQYVLCTTFSLVHWLMGIFNTLDRCSAVLLVSLIAIALKYTRRYTVTSAHFCTSHFVVGHLLRAEQTTVAKQRVNHAKTLGWFNFSSAVVPI